MKILYLFIFFIFFSQLALAEDCINCTNQSRMTTSNLERLTSDVEKALAPSFIKMADLKVNHAGTGDLSILVDSKGNPIALKFHYVDGKDKKDLTVSIQEFNQGKGINYPAYKNNIVPLQLIAIRPPGIDVNSGGEFNLKLATSVDPATYSDNIIKFSKNAGVWQASSKGKAIRKVILSPGISWASWDGSFKEVNFE